jgi:heterodisulfide reductase subunit A-like polyferredoxin
MFCEGKIEGDSLLAGKPKIDWESIGMDTPVIEGMEGAEEDGGDEEKREIVEDFDVIVVGAGLSGLIAARDLVNKGYKVCVFEANDRVGGRVFSSTLPGSSASVDIGGEWVDSRVHHTIMSEIRRYNLEIEVPEFKGKTAWTYKVSIHHLHPN